ncbi:MAG: twin-arginine translocase TatA/TatE family subunit [Bacteriovoracia bacterium]
MFGLSLGHIVILAVVVLLFGSRRLPELGSALGKGMNAFKKGLAGEEDLEPSPGHRIASGARDPDAVLPSADDKSKV